MEYYKKNTHKGLNLSVIIVLLGITINSVHLIPNLLMYLFLIFFFSLGIAVFFECKIQINKKNITFTYYLFKLRLYEKILFSHQIKQIKFLRIGWNKKGVNIQAKPHGKFKINNVFPNSIFENLVEFSKSNNVPYRKTNDYEKL